LSRITSDPTQEITGEAAGIRFERFPRLFENLFYDAAEALKGREHDLHERFIIAGAEDGNHGVRPSQQAEELDQREPRLQARRGETLEGVGEDLRGRRDGFADAAGQLLDLRWIGSGQPAEKGLETRLPAPPGSVDDSLQQPLHRTGIVAVPEQHVSRGTQ
jgi:hypothetical protein